MGGDARYVSDLATGEDLDRLARVYGLVRNRIAVWPATPMRISAERMTEKLAPLETRWETDAEFRERVTAYLRSQRDGQVDAAVLGIDRYTLLTAHVAYSTAVSDLYLAANTRPIDAYPHDEEGQAMTDPTKPTGCEVVVETRRGNFKPFNKEKVGISDLPTVPSELLELLLPLQLSTGPWRITFKDGPGETSITCRPNTDSLRWGCDAAGDPCWLFNVVLDTEELAVLDASDITRIEKA